MAYLIMGIMCLPMFVLIVIHTDMAVVLVTELIIAMGLFYFGYLGVLRDRFVKFIGFCLLALSLVFYYFAAIFPFLSGRFIDFLHL